tara:strand:- start:55200 stop:55811 length:612 start_codon:yes stop_codon:yes gene_type:complete
MNHKIEPKEIDTLFECLRAPLFYFITALFIFWGGSESPWPLALTIPFATALCALTYIDMKHMILPDLITLPMIALGLILHFTFTGNLIIPLLGAVAGFVLFFLIFYISYKIKGEPGMGFGDVKFLAMLGSWVGLSGLPLILLYASMFALLYILLKIIFNQYIKSQAFPFGPFLAIGGWFAFLYHDASWRVIVDLRQSLINIIG